MKTYRILAVLLVLAIGMVGMGHPPAAVSAIAAISAVPELWKIENGIIYVQWPGHPFDICEGSIWARNGHGEALQLPLRWYAAGAGQGYGLYKTDLLVLDLPDGSSSGLYALDRGVICHAQEIAGFPTVTSWVVHTSFIPVVKNEKLTEGTPVPTLTPTSHPYPTRPVITPTFAPTETPEMPK